MIIDSHTHLGRNEHINARIVELLKSMDSAHIDKSLVFAGSLNGYDNETMLEEIKPHRDRMYGVAAWDFEYALKHRDMKPYEQEDKLVNLYKAGDIVAVKFYTGYYHKMPADLAHVLWRLNEVGCPAIFHCGDCLNSVRCAKLKYAHPLNIDEVAVDYPNMNFVIAHMAYPWERDAAEVCYKNKNVFSDISGFVYGDFTAKNVSDFKKVLDEFITVSGGTHKLLFGSDFPISNQKSYVETVNDLIGMKTISENIHKVFNLR